jgi:DNA (cytosine-5)-methyltransferase 1
MGTANQSVVPMTFGSLFAGIGGLDLGLERAGMRCRWQVEINPFCQRVLAKHWPDVKRYGDITKLTGADLERVDLICGGFPCQDVSDAGRRVGIGGKRSGLWSEYIRLVRLLRPQFVLVENVPGLLTRGLGRVLGDLAASGYDAQWDCIPAEAVGAPHLRYRVFIVAHSQRSERRSGSSAGCDLEREGRLQTGRQESAGRSGIRSTALADSTGARFDAGANRSHEYWRLGDVQMGRLWFQGEVTGDGLTGRDEWRTEPNVGRVANGVPDRMDRLTSLGNAVVPQVAEWIGQRILMCLSTLESEERTA